MVAETETISTAENADLDRHEPSVWGLSPLELHEHFWAARGVEVVHQGSDKHVAESPELFLLIDSSTLALFRLRQLVDLLSWARPDLLYVRVTDRGERDYREVTRSDRRGNFVQIERCYRRSGSRPIRVAFTTERTVALAWQGAASPRIGWAVLRQRRQTLRCEHARVQGRVYDRGQATDLARFVRDLIALWKHPESTVPDIRKVSPGVWAHESADVASQTRFVGPIWIGAGRSTADTPHILGPAALWDDFSARPERASPRWDEIEPRESSWRLSPPPVMARGDDSVKRVFDVLFSLLALALVLPIFPLIMAAIWLEDGRPFFFAHRREGRGGREFGCLKFRSMRKDADKVKLTMTGNQADGPQFYMRSDPRVTRVGRLLRKTNLDELPQFINVLLGHMSVVGPRPSPYNENQFCPSWREGRLSMRPGITGLWQVNRTRRQGLDFQEWIRFDLEYVQRRSLLMDLGIIWKTVLTVLGRGSRS